MHLHSEVNGAAIIDTAHGHEWSGFWGGWGTPFCYLRLRCTIDVSRNMGKMGFQSLNVLIL